jgi:cytochrome b involved in lipid metabolism
MKHKIIIPKTGKDAGKIFVEGMEHSEGCETVLQDVLVGVGTIQKVTTKNDGDDNPVYHDVNVHR